MTPTFLLQAGTAHLVTIDYVVLALYFLIIFAIGWYFSRKERNTTDYFLAGRDVAWWAIGASLFSSNIGSEHFIGLAGSGAATGMAAGHFEWLASMIVLRVKPQMPPVMLPLGLFFSGTLIATLLSADPWTGRTGVRKFYLMLLMMLVFTTFRKLSEVRWLVYVWTALMTASAIWSLVQFGHKYSEAAALHQNFYLYYTGERITGFQSHWMTLGGQEMNILLVIAAMWLMSRAASTWLLPACAVIAVSLLAGYTRSIWLGAAVAGLYLIWNWKRWAVLVAPLPVMVLLLANPADIRERAVSVFVPHGDTDSNRFRVVCRRVGAEIVKAHP